MDVFATPVEPASLPTAGGSYVLELCLDREIEIHPGRLGAIRLGPGRLRYYGSARGPGGVRARVARHLRSGGRRHWHVDWLLAHATVLQVTVDLEAGECELVRRDLGTGRWAVAAPGFGSSDCRTCPAHLLIELRRGSSAETPRARLRIPRQTARHANFLKETR